MGFPHLGVVDRWLVTSKRARYGALIVFSRQGMRMNNMLLIAKRSKRTKCSHFLLIFFFEVLCSDKKYCGGSELFKKDGPEPT